MDPLTAAKCRGVFPSSSEMSVLAPALRSNCKISVVELCLEALSKGDFLLISISLTSALARISLSQILTFSYIQAIARALSPRKFFFLGFAPNLSSILTIYAKNEKYKFLLLNAHLLKLSLKVSERGGPHSQFRRQQISLLHFASLFLHDREGWFLSFRRNH